MATSVCNLARELLAKISVTLLLPEAERERERDRERERERKGDLRGGRGGWEGGRCVTEHTHTHTPM